jgi:hypothetical protein
LYHLELAWDRHALAEFEESLCQRIKQKSLGLSSLQRTIANQESRLLWLSEGDVPTRFFHYYAATHRSKNHIHSLLHEVNVVVAEDRKAEVAFSFFDEILGSPPIRSCAIKLEQLDIPSLNLSCLSDRFIEAEVWAVISALPPDKAPRPDGFTACFL